MGHQVLRCCVALSRVIAERHTGPPSYPPPVASLVNLYSIPSAMDLSNISIIIAILLSCSDATFAYFIPTVTATITGSFSIVYPTSTESDTATSSQISNSPSISTLFTSTTSLPSPPPDPPPLQSDTSPLASEFATFLDTPVILASLILLIIALTILIAVLCRVCRARRRWRAETPLPLSLPRPVPPPPDVYRTRSNDTLTIKGVVLSPMGSPTPTPSAPRPPSPALSSASAYSVASDFPSSDIHHVQRELRRGLSFLGATVGSRPASRSSLGTTATKTTARPTSTIYVWNGVGGGIGSGDQGQPQPTRYGFLWDVDLGRWRQVPGPGKDVYGFAVAAESGSESRT
ncbi:hypothetical protein B0H13DRAFT_821969 [Mycena leptocephala]|nr:hypothetical protein B0H13DRAFT_821969 [Mycena leptocephala]